MSDSAQQIVTDDEAKAGGATDVSLWLKKIKAAQDEEKDWREDAAEAIKVFEASDEAKVNFNIFHSNVQTTLPALYNTTPVADIRRRYNDKDPVGKLAVDISERAISYSVDQYPFDKYIRAALKDGEVAGRGTVRVRQRSEFRQLANGEQTVDDIAYQEVSIEPVKWDKWGRGPGRFWEEIPFVYFEHELDADDLRDLMGDGKRYKDLISLGFGDGEDKDKKADAGVYKTMCVYEIWDRKSKQILFVAKSDKITFPLKVSPDELGLIGFFPVPSPLQPIERLGNLVPVTPYEVYQHLIAELDEITKRIRKLVRQLKVRGIIAGDLEADALQVKDLDDGEYQASKNAIQFATGAGGLEKAIAHWPMEPTVIAVKQLIEQREQIKQIIYEVTGISDILRGATDARETLGAQQIKTQWGSLRLQDRQAEVARFCRDIFRMKAELISRFKPEVLSMMTGLPQEKDQQLFPQAIALLQDNLNRRFRIDIETDSTVRADMSRNQEQMNLFMQGSAQFVQGMTEAAQIAPQMLPAMIEVYLSFARRFKLGKQAEDAIESLSQLGEQLAQMAQQQAEKPSPEEEKMKAEMAMKQEEFKLAAQSKAQELQFKERESLQKLQLEREKHDMALQHEREKFAIQQQRDDWLASKDDARAERDHQFAMEQGHAAATRAEREHKVKLKSAGAEHRVRMKEHSVKMGAEFPPELLEQEVTQDEASAITQAVSGIAETQQQVAQATIQALQQLVQTLQQGMAEQTQMQREIASEQIAVQQQVAAQNMRVATAKRKLVKNPDGSKHTELAL